MLVVYGHILPRSNTVEKIQFGLIYSFHMPLFLMLSAITSRYSKNLKDFKINVVKSMQSLLIPAAAVYLIFVFYTEPSNFFSIQFWTQMLYRLVFYSCHGAIFEGMQVPGIGIAWYLVALYIAKLIFDYLQMTVNKKMLLPFVAFASILGIALGKQEVYVLSFDIALAMLPFLYVGYRLKDLQPLPLSTAKRILCICGLFVLWLGLALLSYDNCLDIASRCYPLYPLCFIAAIAGSLLFMELAKVLAKIKIFLPLQFLGRYCIYFYFVHCIDVIWSKWFWVTSKFVSYLLRVAIDLAFFFVLLGLRFCILKIVKHHKAKKAVKKGE